jgi:fructose-1,6-bisphosphatase I
MQITHPLQCPDCVFHETAAAWLMRAANPLALLVEHAGWRGSDGMQNILDIPPQTLHQRTPFFIGSRGLVERVEEFIRKYDG